MHRASLVRTALCLFITAFIVSQPHSAFAQTISDPGIVEFDPSPDHSRVGSDGTPFVSQYQMYLYVVGQSSPFATVGLGKPAPQTDGKIRVNFLSMISPLTSGVLYEARVTAAGPGGTATSLVSNQFQVSPPCTTALSSGNLSAASSAGSGSVNVTSPAGCTWTSSSNANWLSITSGASASGSATVTFNIAANTTQSARTGTMTIAGGPFTVTQAPLSCSYALSATTQSFTSAAGTGSVTMNATNGCAWTANSNASWLTVTSGASGSGTGTVGFSASANTGTAARTGTLSIAGQTFTVSQTSLSCSYTVSPNTQALTTGGGAGSVTVAAPVGCAWAANSSASWLTITSGGSGNGNGTIAYNAAANTGATVRTATLAVDAQAVTLSVLPVTDDFARADGPLGPSWTEQSANTLTLAGYTVRASTEDFVCSSRSVTSGAFSADQSSQIRIARLDRSDSISVTVRSSGSLATGNFSGYLLTADGTTFSTLDKIVSGNGSPILNLSSVTWATGDVMKLTVSGRTLAAYKNGVVIGTITDPDLASGQPGACIYESWADGAGTSFDSWAGETTTTTTSLASASSVSAQSTPSGVTLTQAGVSCSYGLSGTTQTFTSAGGTGSVNVTGQGGCAWTAASSAPWLAITGGATGNGPGTVAFNASANTSTTPRTATLSIAGQTFTVSQAALSCTYSVPAAAQSLAAAGGSGSVGVTTQTGCAWSASSSATWLPISPSSSTGAGQVTFSASANTTTTPRMATLTVAGTPITVTQDAASCSYGISPSSTSVASTGGTGTASVTTTAGCAWTSLSGVPWITITAGASGSGGGTVSFQAAANTTTSTRTGTLTIAGQAFTVTQPGTSCTYVVSPLTLTVSSSGGTSSVTVSAGIGCAWSATSNAAWLTPGVGSAGTGGGSVAFTAASNTTSSSRTGTLTIAGKTVTVTQSAPSACNISLSTTSRSINAKANQGTITVTAGAGCNWTATSSASWLTVSSAVVSKGLVTYLVTANNTNETRTGTITIGGVTFTLTQRGDSSPTPPSRLRVVSSGN
jgi:Viral BACON domain/Putative binding domain, N-terminal